MTLEFIVYGVAVPKGSTQSHAYYAKNKQTGELLRNHRGEPILLTATSNANPKTKAWADLVKQMAHEHLATLPPDARGLIEAGVRITLAFYLPRPKSLPRRVLANLKAPDLDKLVRNVFDSLTQTCFRDDAQVVDLIAMKRYAGPGESPHALIRVEPSEGVVPLAHDQPLFASVR
jgi:Holliday junction resolvase RusA-like endonuclease